QLLGGDCILNEQCTMKVSNSSCLDGACRCVEGFLQFRKHTCLGPAPPGSVCYSHAHCQMFSTKTHCDFLIPNLFGRCQCTAPAKLKAGNCIEPEQIQIPIQENQMQQLPSETTPQAQISTTSTTTSTTTSSITTTTTAPAPVIVTEAPFNHPKDQDKPLSDPQIQENVIVPAEEVEENNVSVEEQDLEDSLKPSQFQEEVKIEAPTTQQAPLTPAHVEAAVVEEHHDEEDITQDTAMVTEDYPYKPDYEYNDEHLEHAAQEEHKDEAPAAGAEQHIEDALPEEEHTEEYSDVVDNTMNFDYEAAQQEMEEQHREEENPAAVEEAHDETNEGHNQEQNAAQPLLMEDHISAEHIEQTANDAMEFNEPTSSTTTLTQQIALEQDNSHNGDIHLPPQHQHDELVPGAYDDIAENESENNEIEATTLQQQQQEPLAPYEIDEVITTQPEDENAAVLAVNENTEESLPPQNPIQAVEEETQEISHNATGELAANIDDEKQPQLADAVDVDQHVEYEKLENQQTVEDNNTGGQIADSNGDALLQLQVEQLNEEKEEQQHQQQQIAETTNKIPTHNADQSVNEDQHQPSEVLHQTNENIAATEENNDHEEHQQEDTTFHYDTLLQNEYEPQSPDYHEEYEIEKEHQIMENQEHSENEMNQHKEEEIQNAEEQEDDQQKAEEQAEDQQKAEEQVEDQQKAQEEDHQQVEEEHEDHQKGEEQEHHQQAEDEQELEDNQKAEEEQVVHQKSDEEQEDHQKAGDEQEDNQKSEEDQEHHQNFEYHESTEEEDHHQQIEEDNEPQASEHEELSVAHQDDETEINHSLEDNKTTSNEEDSQDQMVHKEEQNAVENNEEQKPAVNEDQDLDEAEHVEDHVSQDDQLLEEPKPIVTGDHQEHSAIMEQDLHKPIGEEMPQHFDGPLSEVMEVQKEVPSSDIVNENHQISNEEENKMESATVLSEQDSPADPSSSIENNIQKNEEPVDELSEIVPQISSSQEATIIHQLEDKLKPTAESQEVTVVGQPTQEMGEKEPEELIPLEDHQEANSMEMQQPDEKVEPIPSTQNEEEEQHSMETATEAANEEQEEHFSHNEIDANEHAEESTVSPLEQETDNNNHIEDQQHLLEEHATQDESLEDTIDLDTIFKDLEESTPYLLDLEELETENNKEQDSHEHLNDVSKPEVNPSQSQVTQEAISEDKDEVMKVDETLKQQETDTKLTTTEEKQENIKEHNENEAPQEMELLENDKIEQNVNTDELKADIENHIENSEEHQESQSSSINPHHNADEVLLPLEDFEAITEAFAIQQNEEQDGQLPEMEATEDNEVSLNGSQDEQFQKPENIQGQQETQDQETGETVDQPQLLEHEFAHHEATIVHDEENQINHLESSEDQKLVEHQMNNNEEHANVDIQGNEVHEKMDKIEVLHHTDTEIGELENDMPLQMQGNLEADNVLHQTEQEMNEGEKISDYIQQNEEEMSTDQQGETQQQTEEELVQHENETSDPQLQHHDDMTHLVEQPETMILPEAQETSEHQNELEQLLNRNEDFEQNASIQDILMDLIKEEVTVQPEVSAEVQIQGSQKQDEVPDLIAEDSNISEEKIISQAAPMEEATEVMIDPEDKLITFYPDVQEVAEHHMTAMKKETETSQIPPKQDAEPAASQHLHQDEHNEASGDDKEEASGDNAISQNKALETSEKLAPLEIPFDMSGDDVYVPHELESDSLIVETTTISNNELFSPESEHEQAEATTTAGIAELTTQTMLNLASRVTLMEPAAPVATTLRPLMSTLASEDEVTPEPQRLDASSAENSINRKPSAIEIRKRVELSLEAVSLGLSCSTDKQCQLADPNTVCNARGLCDCAVNAYSAPDVTAKQCGAERTGCSPGTFQCRSSGVCISWFFVCDGRPDCNDGSDEECTFNARLNQACPPQAFQCGHSGRCISRAALCDGRKQCPHGEDEHGCNDLKADQACPPNTFRCKSGECLPEYEYCNAIISCRDGSDEPPHLCGSRSMPNFFLQLLTAGGLMNQSVDSTAYCPHRCSNGRCRSTAIVCSGRDGCGDGTDEQTCSVCRCPAVDKPALHVSEFLARHRPLYLW
uniref:EB domain-containing protein n=1 Tax=Stomoxys calcitrans TaxID=35570 RepID=A0A1I8NLN6_STOCA